jgi:hypothetical protein
MIRQISHAIDQIEARLAAAEAPYKAEADEIEALMVTLKRRLNALHWARCAAIKPFEIELDRLFDQQNQEEAA